MQARILSAVAMLALPATPALADSRSEAPRHIALGAETEAPRGYVEMCGYQAAWCKAPEAAPAAPPVAEKPRMLGGGSAFPVILSFDFGIPLDLLEKAGRAATAEAATDRFGWVAPIAAISAAPVALAGDGATVQATPARGDDAGLDLLKKVNRRVNGAVVQRRDDQIFGQGELWRRSGVGPGATGDCEDIAIEKRLQLVAEGFPADRLAFAVVYSREVGLHTILVARTAQGDKVLDSADPYVSDWAKARYSWISVQSMDDPARWYAPGSRAPKG